MYTTQTIFPPTMPAHSQRTLIMKANGGSVTVEALLDSGSNLWVQTDSKSSDGGFVLACGNATVRITPSGGAQYDLV